MKGRNLYIPPDVLIEIEKIKIETGITSTADAFRILARKKEIINKKKAYAGGFRI